MLVSMKSILDKAKAEGYGVAAPNVWDENSVKVAIDAAEEERAPIILDFAEFMWDINKFGKIAVDYAINAKVPVAINLDHGATFEEAIKAIRAGFTSVMVDRSTLSFEENVRQVKEIVRIAHIVGVSVEAELGHVGKGSEYEKTRDAGLTDPGEAVEFVKETEVDCLAVAVGTSHGVYKGTPRIDFDLLEEIRDKVNIPLVLHGGSGTGDQNLKEAIKRGICKVNLFTDLSMAGLDTLKVHLDKGENINLWSAVNEAYKGYKEKLVHYIRLFDSNNRA